LGIVFATSFAIGIGAGVVIGHNSSPDLATTVTMSV
jgi:hypothetical protein